MSAFVSTVATGIPVLAASDMRHVDDADSGNDDVQPAPYVGIRFSLSDFLGTEDYTTGWWPSPGFLVEAGGLSDIKAPTAQSPRFWPNSGTNGRLSFVGVTRDQYGSAVGGCTVRCFRTSTCELVSTVTSDPATGAFIATTPYYEAHFVTVHKAGTPGISGASIDSILPA